jgi:hypothetical protein
MGSANDDKSFSVVSLKEMGTELMKFEITGLSILSKFENYLLDSKVY